MPATRMNDGIQIVMGAAIMGFTLWFFFYGPGHSASGDQARPRSRRDVHDADVRQVCETFPAVSPSAARYDLEKTGSVETTCNNFLEKGSLPEMTYERGKQPPANYYSPSDRTDGATPAGSSSKSNSKASNLIDKLNLQDRVQDAEDEGTTPTNADKGKGKADGKTWASSADDRESQLKQRKERMVLDARRKMVEKDKKGKRDAS